MEQFALEHKLLREAPDLHQSFRDSLVSLHGMLESFFSWFPDFTDHSILHSMDVLAFSNILARDYIDRLNAAECYVLIMACYLHDIGMGVSLKDFEIFRRKLRLKAWLEAHKKTNAPNIIRAFHNELSGLFLRKYSRLFDIPSEDLLFAIIQVSRGHRKTDLYDEKEYPDIQTPSGMIHTAYLSAVIRLADELDVGADRNPEILFDTSTLTRQVDIDAFGTHESIRTVEILPDCVILHCRPVEPRFVDLIEDLRGKLQETLDYCRNVAETRSDFRITQKEVLVKYI